ncbi:MAG TPA: outer membrane beta-barrel protein [Methylomirabilota bacterium]|nr:outer membrane beta-barrel protein [Methylomirabilota bacterium]
MLSAGILFPPAAAMAQDGPAFEEFEEFVDPVDEVGAPPASTAADFEADPYPVSDAVAARDEALFADPAAPGAPPELRPTSVVVAPIRSVSRPVPPSSSAALPVTGTIPLLVDREADDRAAYEPAGLRLGSFQIDASLTSGLGVSSEDGAHLYTAGELRLTSDWDRHALGLTLQGSTERPFDGGLKDPVGSALLDGRLDITDVDRLGGTIGYTFYREDDDSVEVEASGRRSDVHTLSTSLGYERKAGLVGLDLKGALDRTIFTADSDRDEFLLSGSMRLTLDSGATLRPFVEAGVVARLPDAERDEDGYARRGLGGELKGGLAVDTDFVSGEVAVGYARERLDDDRLEDIHAVIGEGELIYSPTPLAAFSLRGSTTIEPSAIAGATGSVTHAVDLGFSYAIRPNIVFDAGAGLSYEDYTGFDRSVLTTRVTAGVSWRLNRTVELSLSAGHEVTDERGPGAVDNRDTRVLAAVTLRR